VIELLEMIALSGGAAALLVWVVVVVCVPRLAAHQSALMRGELKARIWLYAPIWVPAALVVSALLPGVLGALTGSGDHCVGHGALHHHLCLFHPPQMAHVSIGWALAFLPALAAMTLMARQMWRFWSARAWTRALVGSSQPLGEGACVRVVEEPDALAFTVGALRPVVVVSRGLVDQLSDDELRVVLAHERAHRERRDTLWALLDRIAGSLLPAEMRGVLLAEIELAREQACDARAARKAGRVQVAATLLRVARMGLTSPRAGLSVGASSLELRVHTLLADEARASAVAKIWPWLSAVVVVGLGAGPFHKMMERLIALVLH